MYKSAVMRFYVTGLQTEKLSKEFVLQSLKFIFEALKSRKITVKSGSKSLTVAFLSEESIQKLNFQFFGKNKPTNILSFSPTEKGSLGELAVYCDPKRAARQGLTLKEETFYLLLHGVLHLLGYNHEAGGRQARRMYDLQDDIFKEWQLKHRVRR